MALLLLAAGSVPVGVELVALGPPGDGDGAGGAGARRGDARIVEVASREPLLDADEGRLLAARTRASRAGPRRAARVIPAAGAMTGWFAERRRGHLHQGIDYDGETGDPVWAAADGDVVHAGPAPDGYAGYGTVVLIRHPGGEETLYAHLSTLAVTAGDRVRAGDVVGAIGTTGSVTGSHLHFEVLVGGVPVDPAGWLG